MPRRAFTLVETLVVILIVALLLGVLVPALRNARDTARYVVDLTRLGQCYTDFAAWANEHNNLIVNAGFPGEMSTDAVEYYGPSAGQDEGWGMYLAQHEFWPRVLQGWAGGVQPHWHSSYDAMYPEDDASEGDLYELLGTLYNPLPVGGDYGLVKEPLGSVQTEFRLGSTLLTQAWIWSNPGSVEKQQWSRNFARKVRFSEVSHPALKGLLYHNDWPGAADGLHHVAFCDGSVSMRNWADARPTAVSPFRTSSKPGDPVDTTFNGFRGADF